MYQIIQQTDEEKLAMYMKLSKEELAKMLIENQKIVARLTPTISYSSNQMVAAGSKMCDCKHLEKSTAGFYCHGYCKH